MVKWESLKPVQEIPAAGPSELTAPRPDRRGRGAAGLADAQPAGQTRIKSAMHTDLVGPRRGVRLVRSFYFG